MKLSNKKSKSNKKNKNSKNNIKEFIDKTKGGSLKRRYSTNNIRQKKNKTKRSKKWASNGNNTEITNNKLKNFYLNKNNNLSELFTDLEIGNIDANNFFEIVLDAFTDMVQTISKYLPSDLDIHTRSKEIRFCDQDFLNVINLGHQHFWDFLASNHCILGINKEQHESLKDDASFFIFILESEKSLSDYDPEFQLKFLRGMNYFLYALYYNIRENTNLDAGADVAFILEGEIYATRLYMKLLSLSDEIKYTRDDGYLFSGSSHLRDVNRDVYLGADLHLGIFHKHHLHFFKYETCGTLRLFIKPEDHGVGSIMDSLFHVSDFIWSKITASSKLGKLTEKEFGKSTPEFKEINEKYDIFIHLLDQYLDFLKIPKDEFYKNDPYLKRKFSDYGNKIGHIKKVTWIEELLNGKRRFMEGMKRSSLQNCSASAENGYTLPENQSYYSQLLESIQSGIGPLTEYSAVQTFANLSRRFR